MKLQFRIILKFFSILEFSENFSKLWKFLLNPIILRTFPMQVFLVKGQIKNTEQSITFLFTGPETKVYQFSNSIYCNIKKIREVATVFPKNLENSLGRNIEIHVVYIWNFFDYKFLKKDYWFLPNVDFTLDLSGKSLDLVNSRTSRRRRRDIKKLQSIDYSYRISKNNVKDFEFFYWHMYRKYIKNRFGKATIPTSYTTLKRAYDNDGGILFVTKEKKTIAGLLFRIKGKTLYGKCLGFSMINQNYNNGLAGHAALFFLIDWSLNQGITKLNYGNTMPFFEDGIFRYKKEWGMDIVKHSDQNFCMLRLNRLTQGALFMLKENPFIFFEEGVMKGFVILDYIPTKNDLQRLISQYLIPKLDTLVVIAYYNEDTEDTIRKQSLTTEKKLNNLSIPLSTIYLGLQKDQHVVKLYTFNR